VKKLFAIAFTCVYLLPTVGVIKNTHYCMGRINNSLQTHEAHTPSFPPPITKKSAKNNAELFILSDLYSEALVVLLA
jgi:hypothetical protein